MNQDDPPQDEFGPSEYKTIADHHGNPAEAPATMTAPDSEPPFFHR